MGQDVRGRQRRAVARATLNRRRAAHRRADKGVVWVVRSQGLGLRVVGGGWFARRARSCPPCESIPRAHTPPADWGEVGKSRTLFALRTFLVLFFFSWVCLLSVFVFVCVWCVTSTTRTVGVRGSRGALFEFGCANWIGMFSFESICRLLRLSNGCRSWAGCEVIS